MHQGIAILRERLVHDAIKFPTGPELEQVIVDFKSLCGLPSCGGALDGTFMPIKKPSEFGDTYYCYKHFNAIIVLGCVDARGIFTYVNAGRPGSVGDSYTYIHSLLYQKIANGEWLYRSPMTIEGVSVKPFLVADSAFPLDSTSMKCFPDLANVPQKRSFNYSFMSTRRVVEQAFGRLKGRWKIMDGKCKLNDPVFVRQVAMVCCALYNVCERYQCPFEPGCLPDENAYTTSIPTHLQANVVIGPAAGIRDVLATYIHHHRPAPQS